MVRIVAIVMPCLVVLVFVNGLAYPASYHAGGQSNQLVTDSSLILVKVVDSLQGQQDGYLSGIPGIDTTLSASGPLGFAVCSLSGTLSYESVCDSVRGRSEVEYTVPYTVNSNSEPTLAGSNFLVFFDDTLSHSGIDSINALLGVSEIIKMRFLSNAYVLKAPASDPLSVFDYANIY